MKGKVVLMPKERKKNLKKHRFLFSNKFQRY